MKGFIFFWFPLAIFLVKKADTIVKGDGDGYFI